MSLKNKIDFFYKNRHICILFIFIAIFIFFQSFYLNLPFFWDEAWSYMTAIHAMYERCPTMLPTSFPPELSKGHPLLFYFIMSAWGYIFGMNIISFKILALCISVALILSVYITGKGLFDEKTGFFAAILFGLQTIFIAQSTMVLPEVLLALFILSTLYFYIKNKFWLSALFGSLSVLTKETGVVVICALLFDLLLKVKTIHFKKWIHTAFILSIPIFILTLHFALLKISYGWFFYPDHISYIEHNPIVFFIKFGQLLNLTFIQSGRVFLTAISLAMLLFIIIKYGRSKPNIKALPVILIYILFFLIFSSINFFTNRYILSILPVVITILVYFIIQATEKFKTARVLILNGLSIVFIVNTFTDKGANDNTLGYADVVKLHKKVVAYCETNQLHNNYIATHFLMIYNLRQDYLGYISDKQLQFNNVQSQINDKTDYVIISNIELDNHLKQVYDTSRFELIERFENKVAWTEIYRQKK